MKIIMPSQGKKSSLIAAATIGDFSQLEALIQSIRKQNSKYDMFCDKVESYLHQYKGDEIVAFIEKGKD